MRHNWTAAEEESLRDMTARGLTTDDIANHFGMSESAIDSKRRRLGIVAPKLGQCGVEDVNTGDSRSLSSLSPTIRTLDDLLAETNVNTDEWYVERSVVNKWDSQFQGQPVELYQVKAWLKPKIKDMQQALMESLIDAMEKAAPKYPKLPKPKAVGEHMLEICPFDQHFGKLSWAAETGEDYDCKIAEERFRHGVFDLVDQASHYKLDAIWLPLGNDLIHIDNDQGTTANGTVMDVDGRAAKIIGTVKRVLIDVIDTLQPLAPVKVIVVPGNHDKTLMFMMGEILSAWYRNCDRVEVDNTPRSRKYHSYGQTLIGYTHGGKGTPKEDKLEVVMARDDRDLWAAHKYHEWHIGHWHKSRETVYNAGDTYGGTRVRVIGSLCGTDEWHFANGFVGTPKAAEAFVWHREHGFRGHFTSTEAS